MPGTRCVVATCQNSRLKTKKDPQTQHIHYHSFPKDKEMRKKWLQRCCWNGKWNPDSCHVCSEHFTEDDFERNLMAELLKLPQRKILKKTAVPSKNLKKENHSSEHEQQTQERRERQARRERHKIVMDLLHQSSADSESESKSTEKLTGNSIIANSGISFPINGTSPVKNYNCSPVKNTVLSSPVKPTSTAPSVYIIRASSENKHTPVNSVSSINNVATPSYATSAITPANDCASSLSDFLLYKTTPLTAEKALASGVAKPGSDDVESLKARIQRLETEVESSKLTEKSLREKLRFIEDQSRARFLKIHRLLREVQKLQKIQARKDHTHANLTTTLGKIFTRSQLSMIMRTKQKVFWDRRSVEIAFTLLCLSKRAYLYLRNTLHYPLPGLSTLQRWATLYHRGEPSPLSDIRSVSDFPTTEELLEVEFPMEDECDHVPSEQTTCNPVIVDLT